MEDEKNNILKEDNSGTTIYEGNSIYSCSISNLNVETIPTIGILPERRFLYKEDTILTFEGEEYKVQELLDMTDEKFSEIYKKYEDMMSKRLVLMVNNSFGGFLMPEFNSITGTMERVVLERRIIKIEKYLNL